jgi:signal transduction histidine kinase
MKDNGLVRRLRDAAVTVVSGLELEAVLQNVVEAAMTLLDARYAALGVIGEGDTLSEFVHTGFDGDVERIGHAPKGHGILGLLIRDASPLRLRDLTRHPQSYGFPEGHPPMRSFVGVPILVRDVVYGNLYVTEKRGADEFSDADEQLALALAAMAGAAVHNAVLYRETRLRERSLDAIREISSQILSGSTEDQVLDLVAARARQLIDADLAVICVPRSPGDDEVLDVRAASGEATPPKTVTASESLAGEVMRRGRLVAATWVPTELAAAIASDTTNAVEPSAQDIAVGVPLLVRGESFGALTLAVRHFGDEQRRLTETFANHASVMLEYTRTKDELERLLVIEERERIGRDLHDSVIQRLFATGLELQALAARYGGRDPDLTSRLGTAVDGLDDTITQIRATIFALQPPDIESDGTPDITLARIRELALGIVAESARALGFEPDVVFGGDPARTVPSHIATHMLVVVREALSNVARHASATMSLVEIEADDAFVVRVRDNGVGFDPELASTGYGLPNLSERARAVGGDFRIERRDEGGTVAEWRVGATAP